MKCQRCGREIFLPFKCPYCGGHFCSKHRLPENHKCPRIEVARAAKRETKPRIIQEREMYEQTVEYTQLETKRKLRFSHREIKHLTVAMLLVATIGLSSWAFSSSYVDDYFVLAGVTAILITSFFLHEITHKTVAQKYNLWAEFRLVPMGVLLTVISILPLPFFKIISPGAVVIVGFVDRKKVGKISVAGPATNMILSTVFLMIAFLSSQPPPILVFGAAFNAWIALFNLVPFGMLDGFKIFLWNKTVWASAFTISIVLTAVSYPY